SSSSSSSSSSSPSSSSSSSSSSLPSPRPPRPPPHYSPSGSSSFAPAAAAAALACPEAACGGGMAEGREKEKEDFFAELRDGDFTPQEMAARDALLDLLSWKPGVFPLMEWIDRRLGSDLVTSIGDSGLGEISLQEDLDAVDGEPVDPAVFYAGLPDGSFSLEEEALRDAIFEFLASWRSQTLAHLGDLEKDKGVLACKKALLPRGVPLGDWIEKRIGGEVELQQEASSRPPVIVLTPVAKPIVAAKYNRITGSDAGPPPLPPPPAWPLPPLAAPGLAPPPPPPLAPPAGYGGKGGGRREANRWEGMSKDAFFASLPARELLAEERALRGEILRWLEQWPKRRGNAGKVMKLSDCGQDVDVHRVRQALLPSSVQLREWIERRIGGEVELSKDEQGWFLICLRGPPPGGAANAAAAEAFFSGLPRGELNEQEQILRQSVLFYLELHSGDEPGPLLSEAGQDPAVMVAREGFLPEEVTLRTWLERRLASDVQMVQDQKSGVWLIQPAGWVPPPAPLKADGPPPTKEEFFSSLPADSFLDAEEDLREGILTFLESWKESMSPTLASVGKDITVRNSRAKVMPKGTPVTLKEWLERRMGGEIELASDFSGQLRFGFRGELRLPAAAGGKRKRASRSPGARRERAPARPREPRGPPPRPRPRAVCAEGARPRSGPGAPSGGRAALLPHSRPHLFQGKGKPKSSNRGSATESIRVPQNGFPLEATTHT
ncbi:unnamed protein product, partial [Prorocentrum cordatum]